MKRSSHASHVAVPADQLIRKPPGLSWEVAGSLYVAGCTAFATGRAVGAGPGDTVAVSAATGGVGSLVVQLLRVREPRPWASPPRRTPDGYGRRGDPPPLRQRLADRLRGRRRTASTPSSTCSDRYIAELTVASVSIRTGSTPRLVGRRRKSAPALRAAAQRGPPRCSPSWPTSWHRASRDAGRGHVPPRAGGRCLRAARAPPYPGQDRPRSLTGPTDPGHAPARSYGLDMSPPESRTPAPRGGGGGGHHRPRARGA